MTITTDGEGVRRRGILRVLGGGGVVGLAGCVGDDGDDAGADDSTDDPGDDDPETTDDRDDPDDTTEDHSDSDGTTDDEDSDDPDDTAEDVADLPPSEIDFEPEDGWNDDHHDVEVPDEPGTMIAVIGDERIELTSLPDAPCVGGPLDEESYDETIEADEWSNDPFFNALAGFATGEGEGEFPDDVAIAVIQKFVVPEMGTLELLRRDSIEITVRGDAPNTFHFEYRERTDGTVEDDLPPDSLGDGVVNEPMIRWGRDGVVTAVGEIPDEAADESDVPPGPFEIGFRCDES